MQAYSKFYWPLALISLVVLMESQFQNAVLARYPNPELQLSTFALAASCFNLINSLLSFVPQMVTVLARTKHARRICRIFVMTIGSIMTLILAMVAYPAPGTRILAALLSIPAEITPDVVRYLRWLTPLVMVNAMRHYCTGILVQAGATRSMTALNILHLIVLVTVLLMGRFLNWRPISALAGATISSNVIHLIIISWIAFHINDEPKQQNASTELGFYDIFKFFWPVAVTSAMFAMSRPVMYAFVNRTGEALLTVAALRLAFDVSMFFQNPVNQFRHLYTVFGKEDPAGVKLFMRKVTFGLVGVMALLAFTPLSRLLFKQIMGAGPELTQAAIQTLRILCLAPLVISIRNVYHGRMMVGKKTIGMAVGAVMRVVAIGVLSWTCYHFGLLNHVTCAMLLVTGFIMEAACARMSVKNNSNLNLKD
ncbi:MAG: hypothetical protein ABR497_01165 [Kiritimatiellia bacterium]|nr:hypothetical protein [Lentisphaerota bacterium]